MLNHNIDQCNLDAPMGSLGNLSTQPKKNSDANSFTMGGIFFPIASGWGLEWLVYIADFNFDIHSLFYSFVLHKNTD